MASEDLRTAAQALLNEAQPQLAFDQGDLTMFVMDMPNMPPQDAPIVVAQASQSADPTKTDRTIGVCKPIENNPESRSNSIDASGEVWVYFNSVEHKVLDPKSAKVTLLQAPEHGKLEFDQRTGAGDYTPAEPSYVGPDRAVVLVEMDGYQIKVTYFFKVLPYVGQGSDQGEAYDDKTICPQGYVWKISFDENDPNALIYTFTSPTQLTSPLASVFNANLTFADLPGEALGLSQGNTITLDTTAAGHGWFIDTTPWDNSEYIATSNPKVDCETRH